MTLLAQIIVRGHALPHVSSPVKLAYTIYRPRRGRCHDCSPAHGARHLSFPRRHAFSRLREARRASGRLGWARRGGKCGHLLRSLGAERRARLRHGRFQRLESAPAPARCRDGRVRHLGGLRAGLGAGARYKYHIVSRHDGYTVEKSDPFAFRCEEPPRTASIVARPRVRMGRRRVDERARAGAMRSMRRCRSTRCTWARGGACPKRATVRSPTASSRTRSATT